MWLISTCSIRDTAYQILKYVQIENAVLQLCRTDNIAFPGYPITLNCIRSQFKGSRFVRGSNYCYANAPVVSRARLELCFWIFCGGSFFCLSGIKSAWNRVNKCKASFFRLLAFRSYFRAIWSKPTEKHDVFNSN